MADETLEKKLKITAFNGSHRGKGGLKNIGGGHTHLMVEALLEGAHEAGAETENVLLIKKKLKRCVSDFKCMLEHPGKCHLQDDMDELREKYFGSDIVLWASPIYGDMATPLFLSFVTRFFSDLDLQFEKNGNPGYKDPHEPTGWKKLMSGLGAMIVDPYYDSKACGEWRHKQFRQQKYPDVVLVTNGGLPEVSQFDSIRFWARKAAEHHLSSEYIAEVYRSGAELFSLTEIPGVDKITESYKSLLRQAGKEIVLYRKITPETQEKLDRPLIPKDIYMGILNRIRDLNVNNMHPHYKNAEEKSLVTKAIFWLDYLKAEYERKTKK